MSPVNSDRVQRLREFGLSEYAARAYLALLDLGTVEARDVSSLSKVPSSKIYQVLDDLHAKGLVEILPEFPKKYAPIPFTTFLDQLQRSHEEAARTIGQKRPELEETFRVLGHVEVGDRGGFQVVRGRRNLLARLDELVGESHTDIVALGTAGLASRAQAILEGLRRAKERGARLRFLVPLTPETVPTFEGLAELATLRAREGAAEHAGMWIFDGKRAVVASYVPDDGSVTTGKDVAIFTDHEAVVAALRSVLDQLWARASTFEAAKAAADDGSQLRFARCYESTVDGFDALRAAVRGGARELLVLSMNPPEAPDEAVRGVLDKAASYRLLVDVRTPAAAEAYRRLGAGEVRHARGLTLGRLYVVDDREAIFAIEPEDLAESRHGLTVHTTNPGTVAALRAAFEHEWAAATPLAERVAQLREPGHTAARSPLDLASQPLAVLADGRIVEANGPFARLAGLAADAVLGRALGELVAPESRGAVERAAAARYAGAFEVRFAQGLTAELRTRPLPEGRWGVVAEPRTGAVRLVPESPRERASPLR